MCWGQLKINHATFCTDLAVKRPPERLEMFLYRSSVVNEMVCLWGNYEYTYWAEVHTIMAFIIVVMLTLVW